MRWLGHRMLMWNEVITAAATTTTVAPPARVMGWRHNACRGVSSATSCGFEAAATVRSCLRRVISLFTGEAIPRSQPGCPRRLASHASATCAEGEGWCGKFFS